MSKYNTAVLLPTRGRTTALTDSVTSIVNLADSVSSFQLLLGFDNDDTVGLDHFTNELQPWLDDHNVAYTAMTFDRQGYVGLNRYYNTLASHAESQWLFLWNDDAIMNTQGWDSVISKYNGQFKLLKVHTHNEHPYSIFPIWPKEWYDLFGLASRHQMIDAELSQNAYMLDLMQIVDIDVTHDRHDLTGNNQDNTARAKLALEGNPNNPSDFHHKTYSTARMIDCEKIAKYLASKGHDMSFWEAVKLGKQDPWEKLKANDVNKQCVQLAVTK